MDEDRVRWELAEFREAYTGRFHGSVRSIVVENVRLAAGWTPRVIPVRLELSAYHPRAPPKVVLPGELRWHGVVPRHWLTSGRWLVRGHLGDPIIYYPAWSASATLADVVEEVLAALDAVGEPAAGEGCDA